MKKARYAGKFQINTYTVTINILEVAAYNYVGKKLMKKIHSKGQTITILLGYIKFEMRILFYSKTNELRSIDRI